MERREALRRLAAVSAGASTGAMIVSSPAFADGGSGECRSTPSISNSLTPATLAGTGSGANKDVVRISSSTTSFPAAACGCGWTSSVQRRWTVTAGSGTATGIYSAVSGGTLLSGGFNATAGSVNVPSPVYVRHVSGGNLTGSYTVDLTIRHVCRSAGAVAWSCQRYRTAFSYSTAGGPNGTISAVSSGSFGPPDNSAFCDSPAPV